MLLLNVVRAILFPAGVVGLVHLTRHHTYRRAIAFAIVFGLIWITLSLAAVRWLGLPNNPPSRIPDGFQMAYQLIATPILSGLLLTVFRFFINGYTLRAKPVGPVVQDSP